MNDDATNPDTPAEEATDTPSETVEQPTDTPEPSENPDAHVPADEPDVEEAEPEVESVINGATHRALVNVHLDDNNGWSQLANQLLGINEKVPFDKASLKALHEFQYENGIPENAFVDDDTWAHLFPHGAVEDIVGPVRVILCRLVGVKPHASDTTITAALTELGYEGNFINTEVWIWLIGTRRVLTGEAAL